MAHPFTLRPFQNADAAAVADLHTRSTRGLWTYAADHFRENPDPQRRHLVALNGSGEVTATAGLHPFGDSAPDALRLNLAGDGAAFTPLYLALLADLPTGFTRLLGVTREDFTEQTHLYQSAGFRNAWQSWGAHLDLSNFDFAAFQPLEERLYLQGYEVDRWPADAPDAGWAALYALHRQGERDVPSNLTTTAAPLTREAMQAVMTGEEAVFVVRHRGELVALTRLTLPDSRPLQKAREVSSDLTTTHPAHRGQGLATLVKARALAWARDSGYTRAGTGGTVLNLPMLRVNTRLSYRTEPMWITWERRLR